MSFPLTRNEASFLAEALGLQKGKPGIRSRAFQTERKGGFFMTLIVKLVLHIGTVTVTISARKSR